MYQIRSDRKGRRLCIFLHESIMILETLAIKIERKRFKNIILNHCVKIVRIRRYSGPYFSAFRLSTERHKNFQEFSSVQSECRKIRTRITLNTDTFQAVNVIYRQTNGDLKVSENYFHNFFSKNEINVLDFETNKKIFESNIF